MKRTCKKCGVEKDIAVFVKDKTCIRGRSYTCRRCASDYMNKRYADGKCYIKKCRSIPLLTDEQKKINREKAIYKYAKCPNNIKKSKLYRKDKDVVKRRRIRRKNMIEQLSDLYIKQTIRGRTKIKFKDIPQALVDLQREKIKIHRFLKEQAS